MTTQRLFTLLASAALGWAAATALAAAAAEPDPIAEYRALFGEDNPAELWEERGQALWKQPRGTRNASLEGCDLGLGAGVTAGAYAQLPRWFADTKQVQDLESRLLTCMVGLQGLDRETILRNRFGDGDRKSDLEALTAWLAGQSRGHKVDVQLRNRQEREAYETGKAIFFYRAGPHDFSCASCHGEVGKRIRLQSLPGLLDKAGAQFAYTTWPGYRVSQGELRTLQWRLTDCFRQQRLPQLQHGSPAAVALTMFMAHSANGGTMDAPNLKR
jgi:L-cysteine S-thiosulfotransferase